MKFKPGESYELTGREDRDTHYRCWYAGKPLKARYVHDEEIDGQNWHLFVTLDKYGGEDFLGKDGAEDVLVRVRFPADKAQILQDKIYSGDNIKTRKILSKRSGEPHWYYDRTQTINDFIDKAWELIKDNDSPDASLLKERLRYDRGN